MKKIIKDFLKQKQIEFNNEYYIHLGGFEFKEKESGKIIDGDELEDEYSDFIGEILNGL